MLNFSQGGVRVPTFFGPTKFEVKNFLVFFPLLYTLDSEFVNEKCLGTNFFWVMLNLRSKIFRNFFVYRVLWTLNCSGKEDLGINSFWSC